MPSLAEMIQSLFGGGVPKNEVTLAPPLTQYPSSADAQFARQSGFGYGQPTESYVQGNVARVLGSDKLVRPPDEKTVTKTARFIPQSGAGRELETLTGAVNNDKDSRNLDLTDPNHADMRDKVGDVYARGALAANRNPIAALGFDPSHMVLDTEIKNPNIGGIYDGSKDAIYSNLGNKDFAGSSIGSVVHESIHRGLNKLRQNPEYAPIFKGMPPEESAVRYMMHKYAGDPEFGEGQTGDEQRQQAIDLFENSSRSREYQQMIDKLMRGAETEIARQKPRGPR